MYTKTMKDMCVSSQNGRFFGIALFLAKKQENMVLCKKREE